MITEYKLSKGDDVKMKTCEYLGKINEKYKNVLELANEFSEKRLRLLAGEIDKNECVPKEIIHELADNGYLGAALPVEYGGLGLDSVSYGYLTELIGKACASTRTFLTVHTSLFGQTLMKLGSKEQKEKYLYDIASGKRIGCFALSEPNVGSDANSVQTSYVRKEDCYVINGKKRWISLGNIADIFLVMASHERTVSAFIVERDMPGVSTKPMQGLIGGKGSYIAEIEFKDVKIPHSNLVGREGAGFSFVGNTALLYGRYSIAWAGVALAQAALEEMAYYAKKREQFGKKIGQYQLVQAIIADAVTQVHAARALCVNTGILLDTNASEAYVQVNIAKQFAAETAIKVTSAAVQVFGGNGCLNQYPVERLFREAKILDIIEGTRQIQQVLIGKYGIKKYGNIERDYI